MLKLIFGTMVSFYVFIFWLSYPISDFIFPSGGVVESHLKPIYLEIIILK